MNQEKLNQKDTHLNEILEIKNYTEFKNKVLKNIPNLKLMAKNFMQEHIKTLTGQNVDADKIYLHFFKWSSPSNKTYNGWEHQEPLRSLTLTELAFKNFNAADRERVENTLNSQYGVYKEGPGKKYYGTENEVRILPSDLRKILEENDFYAPVKNSLNTFWENHEADMLTLAKATFVSEARRAMLEDVISEDDYKLVMQTVVPHLPLEGPITINQLASKTYSQGYVYSLDINGYSSNDILRFVKNDGREILYIPGEKRPFKIFENDIAMRHWVVEQGKDSKKRSRLENHFSLYNRQDGTFHTGVDNGLLNLASGSWDIKEINKHGNSFFVSDALSAVVGKTKKRSFSDADTVIKSNSEVTWEQWLGYARITNQIFGPIIGLAGGVFGAILATGAFVTQIGMEVHQAVIGDTEEERQQGFWAAGIDIGTMLLFAGFAKFAEMKNELSELSELPYVNTEINIGNAAEKQVSGFIKGLNKSILVVKVAEDGNGRDIWMRYDPLTDKVSSRRYYRADVGSDIFEPVPFSLSERLNKLRTEGLGGGGSKTASRNMAAENPEPTQRLESSQSVSDAKSSLETADDSTDIRNISLTIMTMSELAERNPIKFNIFKMSFKNALNFCSEANRIVKNLNDTELTEDLEKTFGKIKFPSETTNKFRENIEKLVEVFDDYNTDFEDKFSFGSSKNMEESFHPELPPKVVHLGVDNKILINDSLFNLGNGMIEATLIREMSLSKKINSFNYFSIKNRELLVPEGSISNLIPLTELLNATADKLRHINYLLFQHLEDKELALKHLEPKSDLVTLVFGEENALNHQPEEALSKILEDKDLLTKSLPSNAESLMQLVLYFLFRDLEFVDNKLTIKNIKIAETKYLLDSPEGKMPLPYYDNILALPTGLDIKEPIGELISSNKGLVIKPGEYYRWLDMEKINPIRLDIIKKSLQNSKRICFEVEKLVDKMNDRELGEELSNAFSIIVFSPDQVEKFRENIKKISYIGSFLSKEENYKLYFCFFSSDDYRFKMGEGYHLPESETIANKRIKGAILINDRIFNESSGEFTHTIMHEMSHLFRTVDNYYNKSIAPSRGYKPPLKIFKYNLSKDLKKMASNGFMVNKKIFSGEMVTITPGKDLVQSVFGESNHEVSEAINLIREYEVSSKVITSNADSLVYFIIRLLDKNNLLTKINFDEIGELFLSEKGREKFPPLIVGKENSVSNETINKL